MNKIPGSITILESNEHFILPKIMEFFVVPHTTQY